MTHKRIARVLMALLAVALLLTACGSPASPAPATAGTAAKASDEYNAQTITVEGLPAGNVELTIAQLRGLEQHPLDASYKRTTGLVEEFQMEGAYLADVIALAGGNLADYEGVGITGVDGYYCLISKEVVQDTPDLMLALTIDGSEELKSGIAPAQLAAQGQFGPYWVKAVSNIKLYTDIPQKDIASVWVFDNLAQGITPYQYEYYGSKDNAIDMEQVWSRLDDVDTSAFFTMKSSDGFLKNEAMNMVLQRYYIKVDGEDAPTNISLNVQLGMNVQHIAWVSSNADAMIFPAEMEKYMAKQTVGDKSGITLEEILYETQVEKLQGETFDVLGTAGEKVSLPGEDLAKGILVINGDGSYSVVWQEGSGYADIPNLMRVRRTSNLAAASTAPSVTAKPIVSAAPTATAAALPPGEGDAAVLSVTGDGIARPLSLSLSQLKALTEGYVQGNYSIRNNWPTKETGAAKGMDIAYLLELAGVKAEAQSIALIANDGFSAGMTMDQLQETRYYYPNLRADDAGGAVAVPSIVAWEEGDSLSDTTACELRAYVGQNCLTDVNSAVGVKGVATIEVSTADPGQWPQAVVASAQQSDGAVTVTLDTGIAGKIYYTTDGSEPTRDSALYNPSTDNFQPQLNVPVTVDTPATLKFLVTGFGKGDSDVLTLTY